MESVLQLIVNIKQENRTITIVNSVWYYDHFFLSKRLAISLKTYTSPHVLIAYLFEYTIKNERDIFQYSYSLDGLRATLSLIKTLFHIEQKNT